jgi:hypothetical protein
MKAVTLGRAAIAAVGTAVIAVTALVGGVFAPGYTQSFDGQPLAPQNFASHPAYADFDVQTHHNAVDRVAPMNAQHGQDCSGPPASHAVSQFAQTVFVCRDHIMTAINGSDPSGPAGGATYAAIYLTPNRMLDFGGPLGGSVQFEISTSRLSTRDWWDLTVSPFQDSQALPLLSLSQLPPGIEGVDLQKANKNSVVVTTDNGEMSPNTFVTRGGAVQDLGRTGVGVDASIAAGTNQAAVRQPFKLTLTPTHIRFERLVASPATGPAIVYIDRDIPALSWTQGVVQLGHHSYNPTKDGGSPNTWHWDQLAITPAVPFTIIHFPTRATSGGTVTASAPAPANAYLRFAAVCKPTVNGTTPAKMTDSGHPEHFSSYLMPITQGTQSFAVSFSADGFMNQGCSMQDYSIFSLTTGGVPSTPTPPTTSAPSSSPSTPPAATPSPSPSTTPSPTPSTSTPSPAPSPSPNPSPSPTPITSCRVWVEINGVPQWVTRPVAFCQ